ncbi:MAG: ArsR/SmtB family transcription factor [Succiniclasticum sp.]|jgi:DNA-binding transcriptional ArsR family regulator
MREQNRTRGRSAAAVLNFNETVVRRVRSQMLDEERTRLLAEFFKVLGDPTRVKIINALANEELCVSDLAAALEMTQSAVSHQLKLLRMANQVKTRREGKSIFYSLDDQHVLDIQEEALTHISHKMTEHLEK